MLAPLGTGAAALRAELDQNKVVTGETSIDDAVKAKFRYAGPGGCGRDWKFLLQSTASRCRKGSTGGVSLFGRGQHRRTTLPALREPLPVLA